MNQAADTKKVIGISLFLTSVCNTGCCHCMYGSNTKNPIHFPIELAEELAREIVAEDYEAIIALTGGGEPLMHPQFLKIADTLGECTGNVNLGIITSGFRTNVDDLCRRYNLHRFMERQYVINEMIEHSFHLYHPSFPERLVNAIKLAHSVNRKTVLSVRMCCSYENCIQTWCKLEDELILMVKELGWTCYDLPAGWNDGMRPNFSYVEKILEERWQSIDWRMEKAPSLFPKTYVIRDGKGGGILLDVYPGSIDKMGKANGINEQGWTNFVCNAFREQQETPKLFIDLDGRVYPECCLRNEHMCLGKIGENSIAEMIQKKRLFFQQIWPLFCMDNRMFEWGTLECCELCRKIVFENGLL